MFDYNYLVLQLDLQEITDTSSQWSHLSGKTRYIMVTRGKV